MCALAEMIKHTHHGLFVLSAFTDCLNNTLQLRNENMLDHILPSSTHRFLRERGCHFFYTELLPLIPFNGWPFICVNLIQLVPLGSCPSACSTRKPLGISVQNNFMGWMSFLPTSHQCQSTEGNTMH